MKLFGDGLDLPRSMIVGSAVIDRVEPTGRLPQRSGVPNGGQPMYAWHLTDVERITQPFRPTGHPQPVWFEPCASN